MKRGLNKTELIGNVGAQAILRTIPASGMPVLNFSLAVNDYYIDRGTGEEINTTDWFRITIWGERAKALATYITKGVPLYLEGRIGASVWQPREEGQPKGEPRVDLTLKVKEILFLDGKKETENLSGAIDGKAQVITGDTPSNEELFIAGVLDSSEGG